MRSLRENFGKVYVNVGEPVPLEPILDGIKPDWRDETAHAEERPPWMNDAIDVLGARIMSGINSAAAVTPISLLATVLLASPKQSVGEQELIRQLYFHERIYKPNQPLKFRMLKAAAMNKATGDRCRYREKMLHIVSEICHEHCVAFGRVQNIAQRMRRASNHIKLFAMGDDFFRRPVGQRH